jgi:hypothetical protein
MWRTPIKGQPLKQWMSKSTKRLKLRYFCAVKQLALDVLIGAGTYVASSILSPESRGISDSLLSM